MAVNDFVERDDRPAYVCFERRAEEDKPESLKRGYAVMKDVDYALVTPPYSRDCFDFKVDTWLKNEERHVKNGQTSPKVLEYWKEKYEAWKKGEELPEIGTPIKGWSALTPAQTQTVLNSGIRTVEDLAGCNDEGLRRLGMGGRDLVSKAKSWLKSVQDHGKVSMENAELVKQNENLKVTVESLEEKVRILSQKVENTHEPVHYGADSSEITAEDILPEPEPVRVTEPPRAVEAKEYTRLELKNMYKERFGRRAHPRSTDETLKKKLGL